ncbi:MAG: hypothetical protein ACTTJ3_07265 [Treponema sp.]
MEQYESVTEEQIFIEDDIDSTFTKLEHMQDEIITKKICQLETRLKEIEDVAISVIENSNYTSC